MIMRRHPPLSYLGVICVMFQVSLAHALAGDDEVLLARAAYDKKNNFALTDAVTRLKELQHPLAPYADYWSMLANLDDASPETVNEFLTRNAHIPFADRLRGEWLKKLGKQQNWALFRGVSPAVSTARSCGGLLCCRGQCLSQ